MELVQILEPIVIGIVIVLGGGQVYLWLKYVDTSNRVIRLETEQGSIGRTLKRMDENIASTGICVHSIDTRLAKIEGKIT